MTMTFSDAIEKLHGTVSAVKRQKWNGTDMRLTAMDIYASDWEAVEQRGPDHPDLPSRETEAGEVARVASYADAAAVNPDPVAEAPSGPSEGSDTP